jgi:hypothetical protein
LYCTLFTAPDAASGFRFRLRGISLPLRFGM